MNAVAMGRQDRRTPEAAEALDGLARLRLSGLLTAATALVRDAIERGHARVVVDLQAVSRALRTSRTIAAFALSTGTGM